MDQKNAGAAALAIWCALQVGGLQIPWLEVQDSRCAEGAIVAATYADDGAVQIDVDFDPVWGYPVSLYIGQDWRIADEEP